MDQFQDEVLTPAQAPTMVGTNRLTFRNLMDRVEAAPELAEGRRAEMLSALRTVARCLGADPGDILAAPASLRKKLRDAPYMLAGIGKRRWTGCRSLILAALRLAGLKVMPGRRIRLRQSPAWEVLRSRSPDRQNGIGLSRFMGFCTAEGIEPGEVDPATFARFKQELESNSLVRDATFCPSHHVYVVEQGQPIHHRLARAGNPSTQCQPPLCAGMVGVPRVVHGRCRSISRARRGSKRAG